MDALVGSAKKFGIGKLAALIGVGAGLIAAMAAIVLNLSAEPMQVLYPNMDIKTASAVTAALDQAGVKYTTSADGTTVMVPRDQVGSSKVLLARQDLPASGSVGWELFDNTGLMGLTDSQTEINRLRATQGELERTLREIEGVTAARVQLYLPDDKLFQDEPGKPTASVQLGMGVRRVPAEIARAAQVIVSGGVGRGLTPEMVTVTDQKGVVLAAAQDGAMSAQLADTRREKVEADMAARLTNLVEGMVGPGNARVQVSAELDMSSTSETQNLYNPDAQVVANEQTSEENASDSAANGAPVTAAANTPAGAGTQGGAGSASNSSGRTESSTTFLNSNTVTTRVIQPGAVKRLSVAVVVNNATGEGGASAARTPEQMAAINTAVRAAMGFDEERNDQVSVTNQRFEIPPAPEALEAAKPGLFDGFGKNDIMRSVELLVMAVVAVLILLLGVRPLLKSLGKSGSAGAMPMLAGAGAGGLGGSPLHVSVPGPNGEMLSIPAPDGEQRIDMSRIEGQVKASSVKQVSEFVDKHPEESVSILRSWLHETV